MHKRFIRWVAGKRKRLFQTNRPLPNTLQICSDLPLALTTRFHRSPIPIPSSTRPIPAKCFFVKRLLKFRLSTVTGKGPVNNLSITLSNVGSRTGSKFSCHLQFIIHPIIYKFGWIVVGKFQFFALFGILCTLPHANLAKYMG